ncbi:DUF6088 family protein [Hyphococcus luteus]|uniref:Type IV toxin-antitoxin system AbiEi family antitoxin domain-containing protein n=1 Tax=Hyphococcus luteus TaxID=2058213 RepID=A0A2S7K777_9PROT|nr:DUF6088 family protein [Marinicaulis flavus]PQA88329.1 hypothetical protein CW354_08495 [Marinicaulis flavus]
MKTTEAILRYAEGLPEGAPIAAKALLHLGERANVDQALSRLVKRGVLIRAGRGVYTRPVVSRFGKRAPTPEKFVEQLSAHTGEAVAPSGAAAANMLGLTTQNPASMVYLTSGRTRSLALGRQKVELRHAPAWLLQRPMARSGQAVRALAWMGREHAPETARRLGAALNEKEKQELLSMRPLVPGWMAKEISVLAV